MQYHGAFFSKMRHESNIVTTKRAVFNFHRMLHLLDCDVLNKTRYSVDLCFGTSKADKLTKTENVDASHTKAQNAKSLF